MYLVFCGYLVFVVRGLPFLSIFFACAIERQTFACIRCITLRCSEHALLHHVPNAHHAVGSGQLGFGVRQCRVERPAVCKSGLIFLFGFFSLDGPAVGLHATAEKNAKLQNHELPTEQMGLVEAEKT